MVSRRTKAAMAFLASLAMVPLAAHDGDRISDLDRYGKPVGDSWTTVEHFDSLAAASLDDVRFATGPRWQVRASGDPRALAQLRYMVRKEGLIVGRVSGPRDRFGKAVIEITAPTLRAATAAGSGQLTVDRLRGSRTSVTVAGSSDTVIESLESSRLDATVAGSGKLTLSGKTTSSTVTVAGSGSMSGDNYRTGTAQVTMAGSGNAHFHASGPVRATLVGSGTVTVTGTTDCRQTRMGSGRLTCRA